jgi:hypothetical protein
MEGSGNLTKFMDRCTRPIIWCVLITLLLSRSSEGCVPTSKAQRNQKEITHHPIPYTRRCTLLCTLYMYEYYTHMFRPTKSCGCNFHHHLTENFAHVVIAASNAIIIIQPIQGDMMYIWINANEIDSSHWAEKHKKNTVALSNHFHQEILTS